MENAFIQTLRVPTNMYGAHTINSKAYTEAYLLEHLYGDIMLTDVACLA